MKKRFGLLSVLLMMILCLGLLSGCSENTTEDDGETTSNSSSTDSDTTYSDSGESDAETSDAVGAVTYVGDTYLTIDLYEADTEITDYTELDSVTLSDTGDSETVSLDSDAVFQYVSAESLYSTTIDDIAVGDIVAITTDEDGLQEVIILDYDADNVIE